MEEEVSLLHHHFTTGGSGSYAEIFGIQFVVRYITCFKQWKFKARRKGETNKNYVATSSN